MFFQVDMFFSKSLLYLEVFTQFPELLEFHFLFLRWLPRGTVCVRRALETTDLVVPVRRFPVSVGPIAWYTFYHCSHVWCGSWEFFSSGSDLKLSDWRPLVRKPLSTHHQIVVSLRFIYHHLCVLWYEIVWQLFITTVYKQQSKHVTSLF